MLSQDSDSTAASGSTASAQQPLNPIMVDEEDAKLAEVEHEDNKTSSSDEDDMVALLETAPQSVNGPIGVFPLYCAQGGAVGLAVKSDSAMSSVSFLVPFCNRHCA